LAGVGSVLLSGSGVCGFFDALVLVTKDSVEIFGSFTFEEGDLSLTALCWRAWGAMSPRFYF
jgi:hypothetical protein